ncbi:hypothetical protein BU25DRAFT_425732 [Macroventuria anomochaeta]|uniref:Uncharacterized protein n=1 Tax=Macroventuria anomochaeta TaxID=301207 RepID=A0ACB6RMK6_9PLEO|nr:uncharacterized protein BU25DRAFT_425732 [Macroventuria anomochaeta]KAF2622328.1 hypothetical protein BU25DRAFT_425732 [Macroventuria anomochaeta]
MGTGSRTVYTRDSIPPTSRVITEVVTARALQEIRFYQTTDGSCQLPGQFRATCRLIGEDFQNKEVKLVTRWSKGAFKALQEESEFFLVQMFQACVLAALHGGCQTVMLKDIHLVMAITNIFGSYSHLPLIWARIGTSHLTNISITTLSSYSITNNRLNQMVYGSFYS